MKRVLSMILCVAMLLSFAAVTFAAESTSATISFADAANRKEMTTEKQVWKQNGITVTNEKTADSSEIRDYVNPMRMYAKSSVTIEYPGMTKLVITFPTAGYATAMTEALVAAYPGTTVTTAADGSNTVATIVLTAALNSITFVPAAQTRFREMTIYAGDVTTQPDTPETPEEPKVPATLAEQIQEANKLANKAYLPYESTITGTITDEPAVGKYDATQFKFTVSDGTNTLLCYYVPVTGGTPAKGDKVTVTGKLTAYNGAAQFDSTASAVVEKTATPETPETPEEPEKPAATVVDAPVVGTAYKFGMVQPNAGNKTYYLKGGMNGYYMDTSDDIAQAIDVYLEATEGGYYLYTMEGETKTYINMVVSGTHVNGKYDATASTVYTYDAVKKTVIAKVSDKDYWFGTRNDKNYTTVGPCDVSYNGFYCQFYAVAGAETPEVNPDEEAAKAVDAKIEAIGTVTKDSKAAIEAARAAYDALTDAQKALVKKLEVLTAAEKTLADLEKPTEPEVPAGNKADFDTITLPSSKPNGDSSYTGKYTTANGWNTENSAIQCGGATVMNPQYPVIGADNTSKAVCLNGKTSAPGKVTSPVLKGGISKLVINYTKMFTDTKLGATITITDLSNGKTYTKSIEREEDKDTKYVVWTFEWILETPITGDFTIEIVNSCPSQLNSNKDRMTILDLMWEPATGETPEEPTPNPDEEAAKAVDTLIDAIGTVTKDSEAAIKAARDAYNALTDAQKALVKNLDKLTAAEAALKKLQDAAADQAAAEAVDALIAAIGNVTKDSEAAVKAARDAYNALTDAQKALVKNLKTLTNAEAMLALRLMQAGMPSNKAMYIFSDYKTDQLGGSECFRDLDKNVKLTISAGWFTTEARIYKGANGIITSTKPMSAITLNVGYKNSTFDVYVSEDGETWTLLENYAYTVDYSDLTIQFEKPVNYVKIDAKNQQVRMKYMIAEFAPDTPATGDSIALFFGLMALSMTAVVVLVSKKRAY